MVHVSKSLESDRSADDIWAQIGSFESVDWHPAIASCEASGDKRVLTLGDGGQIHETKTAEGAHTYSYSIEESPLPVGEYEATIAVEANGEGSTVTWTAAFEAEGASDEEAAEVIGGIFDAGLGVL